MKIGHNDDVAEYERVERLAMLENHPPKNSGHALLLRSLALSRGWSAVPEPRGMRLLDKTGTPRAYVAFDDGPGYIEWAVSGCGQLVRIDDITAHPPTMWLYIRGWFEQLPQAIKPARANTGTLDALPWGADQRPGPV